MYEETYRLFVYGTLKLDNVNNPLLMQRGSEMIGECVASGIAMYNLGPSPVAVMEEGGEVEGEVWLVDKATLERTDWLEGYNEKSPESSLYIRKMVDTNVGKCFTYIYVNHDGYDIFSSQQPIRKWDSPSRT